MVTSLESLRQEYFQPDEESIIPQNSNYSTSHICPTRPTKTGPNGKGEILKSK